MISNYGELKAEIALWLNREDLTTRIPTFITLAETKAYRLLRTRDNEFTKTWTEADDPFGPIVLPDNFREISLLTWNDQSMANISSQEYRRRLGLGVTGEPRSYTIIERELRILSWPAETPDDWGTFHLDMIYFGTESIGEMAIWPTETNPNTVPESDGTPSTTSPRGDDATTRLLLVAPDILLYGALAEAYNYLLEKQKSAEWGELFGGTIASLQQEHDMAQFSGSTTTINNAYGDGRDTGYRYG